MKVPFFCSYSQLLFKAAEWKSLPLMAASLAEGKNLFFNSLSGFKYQSAILDYAHHCDTIFMGKLSGYRISLTGMLRVASCTEFHSAWQALNRVPNNFFLEY